MQPSAQGIASLFMGNPGALAQRVDQDRKSSPMGIPDDLRQLMALNIVTTENDAAKRQQALNELNQMAPAGGQPPTVADSVRAQAQQKIQARMMQEQQKQQALQQMLGGQGLPAAPVEFGMAGGGIVSFRKGGETDDEENNLYVSEGGDYYAEPLPAEARSSSPNLEKFLRFASRNVEIDPETGEIVPKSAPRVVSEVPAGGPALPRGIARSRSYPSEEQPAPEVVRRATTPAPARILKSLADAIPQAAPAQATPQEAAAPVPSVQRIDPLARAAEAERLGRSEFERMVGRPDTSALDRLMAEYERQKMEAQGPKEGFDALLEYLGQIAATPRGMRSFEAGAAGARGVQALEKERRAQRAALTEKQIDLEQKKLETNRNYAKELFGVGKQEYDRAYKGNLDLFLEEGRDRRQAETMAHEKTMKELDFKNQEKMAGIRFEFEKKLKGIPQAERPSLEREYVEELVKNKVPRAQAIEKAKLLGAPGTRGVMTRDQAEDNFRKDMENFAIAAEIKKEAKSIFGREPSYSEMKEYYVQKQMATPSMQGAAPTAGAYRPQSQAEFDKLPKGARFINPSDGKEYVKN